MESEFGLEMESFKGTLRTRKSPSSETKDYW